MRYRYWPPPPEHPPSRLDSAWGKPFFNGGKGNRGRELEGNWTGDAGAQGGSTQQWQNGGEGADKGLDRVFTHSIQG